MTNAQTAAIAAAVLLGAIIIGTAITKPWEALRPEPPLCIAAPADPTAAEEFAEQKGCRLP